MQTYYSVWVLLYQNNALVHKSINAMAEINELKFKLLPYAPYLPDLAPSNYFLFLNLKKWLGGQRFANNEEVESAVNGYPGGLSPVGGQRIRWLFTNHSLTS